MILDSVTPNPVVYANPLRTSFHRCELTFPPLGWLLNTPNVKCPYHSCCMPYIQVEHCAGLIAYLDKEREEEKLKPEECDDFVLEHHHERLPYFGQADSYREKIPATWRNLKTIRGKNPDWFPCFAHDPQFRASWEEKCFAQCEKLCTLEQDLSILHDSLQDLIAFNTCSPSTLQAVRANILKVEGKVHEQRKLVFGLFEWASECSSCDSGH